MGGVLALLHRDLPVRLDRQHGAHHEESAAARGRRQERQVCAGPRHAAPRRHRGGGGRDGRGGRRAGWRRSTNRRLRIVLIRIYVKSFLDLLFRTGGIYTPAFRKIAPQRLATPLNKYSNWFRKKRV